MLSKTIQKESEKSVLLLDSSEILDLLFSKCSEENIIETPYIPIIKSSEEISKFYDFLMNENIDKNQKVILLSSITQIFELNPLLIPLFEKKISDKRKSSLYIIGINLYLTLSKSDDKKQIENYLNLLLLNISLSKQIIDTIYQNISTIFRNQREKLTEEVLSTHINLLSILFKDIKYNEKFIKNYIYFNGLNSGMTLKLNENRSNSFIEYPKLSNGLSISFWLNINETILDIFFKQNPKVEICLVNIDILNESELSNSVLNEPNTEGGRTTEVLNDDDALINNNFELAFSRTMIPTSQQLNKKEKIKLILKSKDKLTLEIYGKKNRKDINISFLFNYKDWNNISLVISKAKTTRNKINAMLYLNFNQIFSQDFVKENNKNQIIKDISFFKNFIGKITSLMFFFYEIDNKLISTSLSKLKFGIYKNGILFNIMKSIYNNYLDAPDDYKNKYEYSYNDLINLNNKNKIKHCISPLNDNKTFNLILNRCYLKSAAQNNNNNLLLFTPFTYSKINNTIDDLGSNFIGILNKNDGANILKFHHENIIVLGGINNLLPLLEIMVRHSSILTEDILYDYLTLFFKIIYQKINNVNDANNNNFYYSLSLFLENFPDDIFSKRVLDIFFDITNYFLFNPTLINIQNNFINLILLNEKIFSKFTINLQMDLWEYLFDCYNKMPILMLKYISMSKIILLLKYYDNEKNEKFCCKEHSELLNNFNKQYIMKPELNKKVENLINIINFIFMYQSKDNPNIDLIKCLTFDFSPCLQKSILNIIYKYFFNSNIVKEKKSEILIILLNNQLFDILIYLMTVTLLDIRCEILKLIQYLFEHYSSEISNYLESNKKIRQIIPLFIQSNVLPHNFKVFSHEIKGEIKLMDVFYINKIFNNHLENTWNVLKQMLMVKVNVMKNAIINPNSATNNIANIINSINYNILNNTSNKSAKESYGDESDRKLIQIFILESLINFCCHVNTYFYIEDLCYIFDYIHNNKNKIFNLEDLYTNNHIYSWLIETIYLIDGLKAYENTSKNHYENVFDNNNNNQTNNLSSSIANINNLNNVYDEKKIKFIKNHFETLFIEFINFNYKNILYNVYRINYLYLFALSLKHLNQDNQKNLTNLTRHLLELCLANKHEIGYSFRSKIAFEFMFFFNNLEAIEEGKVKLENASKGYIYKFLLGEQLNVICENETTNSNDTKNENKDEKLKEKISDILTMNNEENIDTNIKLDNNNNNSNLSLNITWKNYTLFNYIMNYYNHMWDIEKLCKLVEINTSNISDYNSDATMSQISNSLIKEYGLNKKMKNILLSNLIELEVTNEFFIDKKSLQNYNLNNIMNYNILNIKSKIQSQKVIEIDHLNSLPIIKIIFILYMISIDIAKDEEEKLNLEKELRNLVIFLILSALNLLPSLKNYNEMQNNLNYLIRFGMISLISRNDKEYECIINNFILPVLDMNKSQSEMKGTFKGFFTGNKYDFSTIELFKHYNEDEIRRKTVFNPYSKANTFIEFTNNDLRLSLPIERIKDFESVNLPKKFKGIPIHQSLRNDCPDIMNNVLNFNYYEELYKFHYIKEIESTIFSFYGHYMNENNYNYNKKCPYCEYQFQLEDSISNIINQLNKKEKSYCYLNIIEDDKKRYSYFQLKKHLFSFNGPYSNRDLFYNHPEKLKYKLCNHITSEIVKPLLTPILDIDYYLPNYSKFDKKNIFFTDDNYEKNKLKNQTFLDIDRIFRNLNLKIKKNERVLNRSLTTVPKKNKNQTVIVKGSNLSIKNNLNIANSDKNIINNILLLEYRELIYKLHYPQIYSIFDSLPKEIDFNHLLKDKDYNNLTVKDLIMEKKRIKYNQLFSSKNNISNNYNNSNNNSNNNVNNNDDDKLMQNIFRCCMVKPTHHIVGLISLEEDKIKFCAEINQKEINKYYQVNNDFDYYISICNKEENVNTVLKKYKNNNNNNEICESNLYYDNDRKTCFGSIFKHPSNHKFKKQQYVIKLNDIKYLFNRTYFYQENSIEIYTAQNKNYFFTFPNEIVLEIFKNTLLKLLGKYEKIQIENEIKYTNSIIGYMKEAKDANKKHRFFSFMNENDILSNTSIQNLWINNQISNLHYLMLLNTLSNRSYKDLTQYPVFPWIISNYDKFIELRDLSLPMGMLEINEKSEVRKEMYLDYYQTMKTEFDEIVQEIVEEQQQLLMQKTISKVPTISEITYNIAQFNPMNINQKPYFYGSHYSNPAYISHYLVRIFPYSNTMIEIQGNKFDDPNRLFMNLKKTFESCTTQKTDVRELTPEFYYLPEMFININRLQLIPKNLLGKDYVQTSIYKNNQLEGNNDVDNGEDYGDYGEDVNENEEEEEKDINDDKEKCEIEKNEFEEEDGDDDNENQEILFKKDKKESNDMKEKDKDYNKNEEENIENNDEKKIIKENENENIENEDDNENIANKKEEVVKENDKNEEMKEDNNEKDLSKEEENMNKEDEKDQKIEDDKKEEEEINNNNEETNALQNKESEKETENENKEITSNEENNENKTSLNQDNKNIESDTQKEDIVPNESTSNKEEEKSKEIEGNENQNEETENPSKKEEEDNTQKEEQTNEISTTKQEQKEQEETESELKDISENMNVSLPEWCDNSPYDFIIKMRSTLESDQVSKSLPKWIDLIFGCNQKGERAEKANNLFMGNTYEKAINIGQIKDKDSRDALMRLVEMGMTPQQIFFTESKNKKMNKNFCEISRYQFKNILSSKYNELLYSYYHSYKKTFNLIAQLKSDEIGKFAQLAQMKLLEDDKLILISKSNSQYSIKLNEQENQMGSHIVNESHIKNTQKIENCYIFDYKISHLNQHYTTIIYNKGLNIIKGGFWDGRLEIIFHNPSNTRYQTSNLNILQDNDTIYQYNSINNSPVSFLAMNESEDILITGKTDGFIMIYDINKENKSLIKLNEYFQHHYEEINFIFINNTLNMFCTSSFDGFVHVYTIPKYKMVKSLKLENGIYAKNAFLSSSPLNCIIIFASNSNYYVYSLNGKLIFKVKENKNYNQIYSPFITKNHNFEDYLIYGTVDGYLSIRECPKLEVINQIKIYDNSPVRLIEISINQRYCVVWGKDNQIYLVKDALNNSKETNLEELI